jgi:hypothetical protein
MSSRRARARRPPARGHRRLWLLAIPIAVFLALFAAMAWADTVPNPTPGPAPSAPGSTPTSKPTPKPTPSPSAGGSAPKPTATPSPGLTPAPPDGKPVQDLGQSPKDGSDGLLEPFDVKDQYGVPISAYTVDADTGDWTDIDLKIWNILAQLFFGIAKWFIGFACWLIHWALDFGLAKILIGPVDHISSTIRDQVINRLGLPGLFLMFAGLYAGWHIMFKQRSRGFAEAGVSLVVAAAATTVLLSPAQVFLGTQGQPNPGGSTMLLSQDGLLGKAKDLSLQISSLVLSNDPNHTQAQSGNVSKPITDALVDAFIVKPTQLMLYGQTFDGKCGEAFAHAKLVEYNYNQLGLNFWEGSRANPTGGETYNQQLQDAGEAFQKACKVKDTEPQAKKASADLTFSAAFVAIAAIIVSVLVVLVTGSFLTAQGWIAFEAIRGHWALCAGILPGGGRATLWRWFSAITKAVLAVVLSIMFLAIFILVVIALVKADTGSVLAVKFIAIDITAVAALAFHKQIKERARQIAVNLNRRLANARVGGARQSVFNSYGRYAETAPGLKRIFSEARGEARRVSQPLGKAGRTAKQLWVGPPQNRRGGRLRAAARAATTVAAAVGTGGTAAAAKVAAQAAAKQTLKKRLATAAVNKMSTTRGGRATMATGKAAMAAGKYGWKATKFAALATVGAPVGIPRGVAATKRGAAAAKVRADEVKGRLVAVKDRAVARVDQKVAGAKAFKDEYVRNVATASRFVGRHGANIQLGLAQPLNPTKPLSTPGPRVAATAPRVPGSGGKSGATPGSSSGTPAAPGKGAAGPAAIPAVPHPPAPAGPATPGGSDGGSAPAAPPRRVRRATRPAGPPPPRP